MSLRKNNPNEDEYREFHVELKNKLYTHKIILILFFYLEQDFKMNGYGNRHSRFKHFLFIKRKNLF